MLLLPDRDVWTFNAYDDPVEIEESVFLAGPDGPRRTVQIVIYGHARDPGAGALDLHAIRRRRRGSRREVRSDEPELPLLALHRPTAAATLKLPPMRGGYAANMTANPRRIDPRPAVGLRQDRA